MPSAPARRRRNFSVSYPSALPQNSNNMPQNEFACDRCGKCCREHRVPLTSVDWQRLLQLGKKIAQAAVEWLDASNVDFCGEGESLVRTRSGLRLPVLKHENGACIFLDESGCTIHQHRPSCCRSYPFDRPDNEAALGLVPGAMCPAETGIFEQVEQPAHAASVQVITSLVRSRDREAAEQAQRLLGYNRRQRLRIKLGRTPQPALDAFVAAFEPNQDKTNKT